MNRRVNAIPVRRSLQRMRDKREKILADPGGYRQAQINKRLPEDFEDLPEEERQVIIAELEDLVTSYDPAALKQEILELTKLIDQARSLEKRECESKLKAATHTGDKNPSTNASHSTNPEECLCKPALLPTASHRPAA